MADAPISEELTALKKRARRRLVGAFALMLAALVVVWSVMDDRPPQVLINQPVSIFSAQPLVSAGNSASQPEALPPHTGHLATSVPAASLPADAAKATSDFVPAQSEHPAENNVRAPDNPVANPVAHDKKPDKSIEKQTPAEKHPATEQKSDPVKHKDAQRILDGFDDTDLSAVASAEKHDDAGPVYLQIAAFADRSRADALAEKVRSTGFNPVLGVIQGEHGQLTRLRAGPFPNRDAANRARNKLNAVGISSQIAAK